MSFNTQACNTPYEIRGLRNIMVTRLGLIPIFEREIYLAAYIKKNFRAIDKITLDHLSEVYIKPNNNTIEHGGITLKGMHRVLINADENGVLHDLVAEVAPWLFNPYIPFDMFSYRYDDPQDKAELSTRYLVFLGLFNNNHSNGIYIHQ